MSVGAHLIDPAHCALIAIINELHDMLDETDGAVDHAVLAKDFKELVTYTHYHFLRGESMLRAVNYNGHAKAVLRSSSTTCVTVWRARLTVRPSGKKAAEQTIPS